jgi:predicted ArsR family transcriptional regulator
MKKLTNSTKVLRYIRKNPNAKAREVAKAVGVSINSVYQCTYNAKKKAKSLPMTALAPVNRIPPKRGRPSKVKTFFATSNKSIKADNVNHPPHYKAGGIETIDFIEAKSLNYNLGNVVKYITRADHKGNKLEDLQKAQWYLNREIKNLSK